jgi:hypothetical protein
MQESYHASWWRPKRLTRQQTQEMIRNMQKSWIINEKSKQYHKKEEIEAENILKKLDDKE